MARILITGSSDGLGLGAAELLAHQHHYVVLHVRNEARAADARAALPEAAGVVVGDLTTIAGMRGSAEAANVMGRFDAVIHNAAVGSSEPRRVVTTRTDYVTSSPSTPSPLPAHCRHGDAEPAGLSQLRHAPWWEPTPRRPAVGASPLERLAGVFRQQALRRRARRGSRAASTRRPVERRRPRLGGHEDGWSRRAR